MIGYLTRKEFELLKKGETKTVTLWDEREAHSETWRGYLETQGGPVCVQVREISEYERKLLGGESPEDPEVQEFMARGFNHGR